MPFKTANFFLRGLALPLSGLYAALTFFRNKKYDLGHKNIEQVRPLVISIGNIVSGGTGKTPWTLKLARDLLKAHPSLAILSRGYRSQFEHRKQSTLICKGKGPLYPPHQCGDEPFMICQNLPSISFYVGKNRVHSAKLAEQAKSTLLLLDDGMQHRRLGRDFECVIIDSRDPLGKGYFLPSGQLRDSPKSLSRADLLLINHVQDEKDKERLEGFLSRYTKAPKIYTQFQVKGYYDLENKPQTLKKEAAIAAFCALGRPKGFYELLEKEGFRIVSKKSLRDHSAFKPVSLIKWSLEAQKRGAKALFCTEKDAVKIPKSLKMPLPLLVLKIEPHILWGQEHYQKFIDKVHRECNLKVSN